MQKFLNNSYLLVDLGQLRRNVETILASLPAGTALIPVLKDDAYGLGLDRIGPLLAGFPQIGLLAVAQVSEGAALRRAGVEKDILVMGGVPSHLIPPAAELGLTVSAGRPGVVTLLAGAASRLGRPARVHVKIETGLHRTGVRPGEELAGVVEELRRAGGLVEVTGVFTHFADLEDGERTRRQYRDLLAGAEQLAAGGFPAPLRHAAASAASEYHPEYLLDGARIGRRLYMDHPTRPLGGIGEVAGWHTWVTNVRALKAGDELGYGGRTRLERDAEVATIAVGYGDGLSEALCLAHGPVLVRGERRPLLECCMDQAFVDVTGLGCRPDDPVTLFGGDGEGRFLSSQEVALLIGGDEGCGLTSALSPRVARVYRDAEEK